jgi:hypothetical protein
LKLQEDLGQISVERGTFMSEVKVMNDCWVRTTKQKVKMGLELNLRIRILEVDLDKY